MERKEFINGVGNAINVMGVKTSHYIIAATGLVTALSWNTAIKGAIEAVYELESDELKANFIYAIVMTCLLVILIWLLPDTKSELPSATRRKLEQAQLIAQKEELLREIEKNKNQMNELKQQIASFETKMQYNTTSYMTGYDY